VGQICDYALLGDCHSAALVSLDGSIDWWCPPRFDAASVLGRLLDPDAGHWSLRPQGRYAARRRYLEGTMVLETEFESDGGVLRLTDALALGAGERGHTIGQSSPHVLLRHAEVLSGEVDVVMELTARPGYGLVQPHVTPAPAGLEIRGAADRMLLTGVPPGHRSHAGTVSGRWTVRPGEPLTLALHHSPAGAPPTVPLDAEATLRDTTQAWRSWLELHHRYEGPYADHVSRSALVLQALTYQPTGAIVAAPTTSLPEEVGGSANWDYRFGWLRDGSLTLKALWVAACPDEASRFFSWMSASAGTGHDGNLPVMFGVGGEWDLTEHELAHLRGYRGSRPVRVGNDAWTQRQLDVLGEVLECAWVLREQLGDLGPAAREFLASVADRAAQGWQETDAGIWEGREGERHYLASKVMCWVALDRAVRLGEALGSASRAQRWAQERDRLRTTILEEGWDDRLGAFTGALGSDHLDAAVLLLPLVGFLPPDDPRVLSTLDAIEDQLGEGALVQRWTGSGDEGAFVICSYWLAEARARAGQVERARSLFEQVSGYANDVGLLAEEVDRRDGSLIGNFPQALSHIGLVNAAWAIAQAETGKEQQWES
jgi:GH15 family glucan-1,4-alpha-glucosidase